MSEEESTDHGTSSVLSDAAAAESDTPLIRKDGGQIGTSEPDTQSSNHQDQTLQTNPNEQGPIATNDGSTTDLQKPAAQEFDELLLNASRSGECEKVIEALKKRADVNAKTIDNETALHLAAGYGHKEVAEVLLKAKADIEAEKEQGWTPLYEAAIEGNTDIVALLLDHGAEVDKQTDYAWTPLMAAIWIDNENIVKLLIDHKANIEFKDEDGWTPLRLAAQYSRTDIARILLKYGAEVNSLDLKHCTPLVAAAQSSSAEMVQILLEGGADVNLPDHLGWTALRTAAQYSAPEVIQTLLKYDPDVNQMDNHQNTPLHGAAYASTQQVVQMLLEKDALVDVKDVDGDTALHDALLNDNRDQRAPIVETLLKWNPQINAVNNDKQTPLHKACEDGSTEVVKLLLQYEERGVKADINAVDRNGWTALHLASSKARGDIVGLLLENNAEWDIKTQDKDPQTALTLAVLSSVDEEDQEAKKNRISAIEILAKKTDLAGKKHALSQAATQNDLILVSQIMLRSQVSEADIQDIQLIWYAKSVDKRDEICSILQHPPSRSDYRAETPLQLAAYHGNYVLVWWILKSTLPSEPADKDREQAEEIAKRRRDERKQEESKTSNLKPSEAVGPKNKDVDRRLGLRADEANNGKDKPGRDERDKFSLTYDMLRDPPPVTGMSESDDPYELPSLNDDIRMTDEYYATIVDFYQQDGRVDFLRRSRTVQDVIYEQDKDGGAKKIMDKAQETLRQISSEAAKGKPYSAEHLKMRWIHLPANNLEWMEHLVKRICLDERKPEEEYRSLSDFLRRSWHEISAGASGAFMKPACLKAKMKKTKQPDRAQAPQRGSNSPDACDNKDGNESSEKGGATHQISQNYNDKHDMEQNDSTDGVSKETASTDRTYERVALYMPYLTFGKCYRDDAKDGEADKNCRDKYQQLLDAYKEKIIHGSRTFDQFYYDSMSDMKGRDASQVVTRALTNHHSGDGIETEPWWPILAVDQLWLWVIDEETIVTCSTHRRDGLADPVVERIWNYLREKKGKGKGQPPPSSVDEMSRFIVNFCTSFVNETSWEASISGRPQGTCSVVETQSSRKSPREIFAETINKKADDEKEMFRGFKEKMRLKKDESEAQDQTHRTILNQQEETQNWQSISKAATVLNEVKDVLDELNILRAALMQQQSVWNELFKGGAELKSERAPTYTIQQIDEMTKITEAIQLSVKDILGLEQNGINIIEAFLSRGQAKESIQQGKTLMVFTVITIFFVPMSFLTSLFALNVSSFQHDPQNNLIYEPGWIFPIIFCTSIGLGLVIIFFAFYFDYARKTWNHFVKGGDGGGPVVSHTTSTTSLAQKAHGSVVSYSQPPEVLEKKSGGEGMWRLGFNQKRAPYHIV